MWCPNCVLVLTGFGFSFFCIFPDLVESKSDSDSSSFVYGKSTCFLIWTLQSLLLTMGSLVADRAQIFGYRRWWLSVLIDSRPHRVFARVRFIARATCLCWWSGSFFFSRTGFHGEILAPLVDFPLPLLTWLYIVMTCLPRLFLPITIPP